MSINHSTSSNANTKTGTNIDCEAMAATPAAMRRAYSGMQKLWHWLMALALGVALATGIYMDDMPFSPAKLQLINYHKWLGVCILGIAFARLFNRLIHKAQPLPRHVVQQMPAWQLFAHKANTVLMYVLFFAIPLVGWLMSSAKGFPVVLFGILPLPNLLSVNRELGAVLGEVHGVLAYVLMALVAVHLLAVVKHQLLSKDGVLWRMF